MSADISKLLQEWPYEPGKINVRLVQGDDGEPCIQIRVDLGILQMKTEGRPDGLEPNGFASLLEVFEARLDEARAEGQEEEFTISADDCRALREEAIQFHHRYIALLALEDYDGVVRDTTRNLRVIDLCEQHAETDQDKGALEGLRPYITMMRARAVAGQAVKDNEPKAAIHAIDEGLESLRRYFAEHGEPDLFERSNEVEMLRGMRESLVPKLPVSQKSELRQRLARAIEQENYELAAILRDELKNLRE